MKTVNTFGCSWTDTNGIISRQQPNANWPMIFAGKHPEIKVDNWARQGSSVIFSASILDAFNKIKSKDDITVFQITHHSRLSFWDCDFYNNLSECVINNTHEIVNNYTSRRLKHKVNFGNITPGDLQAGFSLKVLNGKDTKVKAKHADWYYKGLGKQQALFEWSLAIEYVISRADFVYFHFFHPDNYADMQEKYSHIPCFRDEIGHDTYNDWVIDEGNHLGPQGNEVLADWIYEKIEDQLHV